MSDLQAIEECERRYFLTAIGDFSELVSKEVDVRFEAISWPQFGGKEVMANPLGFLVNSILCEKDFDDLQEIVERARWQGVEPLRCCAP